MALNRRLLLAGVTIVVLAALGAAATWYFALRSDAPAQVSLEGAIASLSATPGPTGEAAAPTTAGGTTGATATTGSPTPTVAAGTATPTTLTGVWQLLPTSSFVGYRVEEQLAGIGANTAVGRTSSVTGSLEFDGTAITAVVVEANLATLRSDDSRRDGALRRQSLETTQFPTARFALTQPISLDRAPVDHETVAVTASGQLTLHGTTRDIEIPLQAQMTAGRVVVVGSMEIEFADYQISPPSALSVLSVDSHGLIELQLVFGREG
jgi:polyisoprenoid-binding protein YceI